MREAPRFRAAPAPTEEEAAAIAAALTVLLEEEAGQDEAIASQGINAWLAEGRSVVERRGLDEFRRMLGTGRAWKMAGRIRAWGRGNI